MSKHFRITLAIIAMLVGPALVAIGVMSTPWFRRTLEHRVIVALEEMSGGRVEIQDFRFHPLVLQAVVHGLIIHGGERPGAHPLLYARTLVVRLSPTDFLHREIRVMSMDWDGAELHLQTNADGSTNLPSLATRYTAGQAMEKLTELRIGRVTLVHSTFFWNDRPIRLDFSARDVAFLLHLRRGARYEGSFSASAVTTYPPGKPAPPLTISTRFVLSQNELAVTSFAWQTRGMTGQGSFNFHPVSEPEGYFSFQTSLDVAILNHVFPLPGLQSGNLRLEGQGTIRHGQVSGRGRLQTHQLVLQNSQFNSGPLEVSADYSLEQSQVSVSNLKLLGWGGSAMVDGQVSLAGPSPQFHIRARLLNLDLAALLQCSRIRPFLFTQLHPASLLHGVVDLTWTAELEKVKSKFDVQFSAPATSPPGFLPVSGYMRGSMEMNPGFSISLADSNFHTPQSSLRATGTLVGSVAGNETPGSMEIQGSTSQIEEWRPLFEILAMPGQHLPLSLRSQASFVGRLTGSIASPQIYGSLRTGEFEYRGWGWDRLEANVAARPDFFQISSGRLAHGSSVLSLEASAHLEDWRVTKTSQIRFSARAQRTPLEPLEAAMRINYPLAGYVSGLLNLQGTPLALEGTGTISVVNGNIAGETFDSFSTGIRVSESTWDLDTIQMVKNHGRMTGKAEIEPANRSFTCQLHGVGFSLGDFKRLGLSFPNSSRPQQLEGQASFDFQGGGTPGNFRFHSIGLVVGMGVTGVQVGDFRVQLDGEGQKLRIQGLGSGPAGMLSLSGDAETTGNWPLQLQGQFVSFRLDPWTGLLFNGSPGVQVTASGSFTADGPLRDSSKLKMRSEIQTLEVSFSSLKWRNEHPVELRLASNLLSVQPFRMQGPSTNLTVAGSLHLADPASLSASVQGVADATILSFYDPGLQAAGHSRIKVALSGSPASPQLNGTVEIEDVSLGYQGLPLRLSNLNGDLQLEGDRVTVKSLRGISGGGTVTLNGFVTLTSPHRIDGRAELNQARIRYPTDFTSILDGTLHLVGSSDRAQLEGDLALRQVLPSDNRNWLAHVFESGGAVEEPSPITVPSLADSIRLNIRVTSPTPVRLEAQNIRLTTDVDVRMQGSLANPVQVGTVHFLSGEAVFRGNRFTLNRGDLNLTNPVRTQASLDLEAQTRVQRYNLTVDISGPMDRLKLAYRSDPPLPSEDVISLLALGYSRQQETSTAGLVSSFSRVNPLQSVGESAILSQALSSEELGRIQRLFGVSRIKIDPNVGLPGFSTGARVTVEQQVTGDLTLTYVTNTASSQYRIIQFEWTASQSLSLIGVSEPNGIFGVELRFRRRFK